MMVFSWFSKHRRHEILAKPFPEAWLAYVQSSVPHYDTLAREEQRKLQDDLRVLIAEKNWEGCQGLVLTDEMRVTIAAQACLLTLALEPDAYRTVESILVYPAGYVAIDRTLRPGGVTEERPSARLGESWSEGPVILSWSDASAGGRDSDDGHNVVIHEFAHKLDQRNGAADGVPALHDAREYDQWAEVMSAEYQQLVAQSEEGRASLLDQYGATNAAEFFAVATECIFEKPVAMQQTHGRLYAVLRDYYRQDPAARITMR